MANGNGHGYGDDEEPTPADPSRISAEARVLASIALEHSHVSNCMWNASRIIDSTAGDHRVALLASLVAELSTVIDATVKTRATLATRKAKK